MCLRSMSVFDVSEKQAEGEERGNTNGKKQHRGPHLKDENDLLG